MSDMRADALMAYRADFLAEAVVASMLDLDSHASKSQGSDPGQNYRWWKLWRTLLCRRSHIFINMLAREAAGTSW